MFKTKPKKTVSTPSPANTEGKILAAARAEFMEKGFAETRMQAIADRANVNKALLHYYFRSKERLLEIIIRDIVTKIWAQVQIELDKDPDVTDLRQVIRTIVSAYINTFAETPAFPLVILEQIGHNSPYLPLIIDTVFSGLGNLPQRVVSLMSKERTAGNVRNMDPLNLVLSITGMIIATFITQPVVKCVGKKIRKPISFDAAFYQSRIDAITSLVCDGLFVKEPSR